MEETLALSISDIVGSCMYYTKVSQGFKPIATEYDLILLFDRFTV